MKFALLLLAALPALAQKVTMEFDRGSDFTVFKTFYMNEGQLNAKSPALNNDLIRKQIQDDIRSELIAKGLAEVTAGPRDLNVRFSLGSARRREVDVYPAGWWGTRRVVTGYTEGTLVIDLHETARRSLVWRTITVEDKAGPAQVEGKLDDMVKKAFERYPPKKK
jgi:Domain of unknown function (DUF4136)